MIFKKELENLIELGVSSSKSYFAPFSTASSWYYSFSPTTTTELMLSGATENSGIQAVYGVKFKATGITNKSAIDVSHMSEKISSLLTPDNHLRLPSGLEVW